MEYVFTVNPTGDKKNVENFFLKIWSNIENLDLSKTYNCILFRTEGVCNVTQPNAQPTMLAVAAAVARPVKQCALLQLVHMRLLQ